MDFKIPIWATRLFTQIVFLFFGILSGFAQTISERQEILLDYNQNKITALISEFEEEAKENTLRMNKANKASGWGKMEKLKDGTVVTLNDIVDDGTLLFYTT